MAAIIREKQWELGKVAYLKKISKGAIENKCVNCGDDRPYVLQKHHADPEGEVLVSLCANCHDIVRRAGLEELKEARDRTIKIR